MIAYIEDRLPVAAQAVSRTRHGVAVSLLPELPEELLDCVLLLTTEVLSQALAASATPWKLRVDVDEDGVLASVRYVPRPDVGADADADERLRGILFDALSTSWGQAVSGDETELWFRVDH